MKTLNKNQKAQIKMLTKSFIAELDSTKKDLLEKEIIAKFGLDNFNEIQKELNKSIPKAETNVAPKEDISDIDATNNDADITNDLLLKLSAIGITDKVKEKSGKSIFKSEFNNKKDRTKCRLSFLNSIELYLIHKAKGKIDLAHEYYLKAKEIAIKYYIAEDKFLNKSDYCTDNMDANKKSTIELFISELVVEIAE